MGAKLSVMADLPELWTERTPERRYLFDREPTFGVAREAERMREGVAPERRVPKKPRRERGPFVTYMRVPWSYSDRTMADTWHRFRCRLGRHEVHGGHAMQLGSATVFVERRCRWCGLQPA